MGKKLLFILVLFVLGVSVSQDGFQLRTDAEREIRTTNPQSSSVSTPIHIDGNLEWLDFKYAGNCTGEGTSFDPYIIQNIEIDSGGLRSCILIENSDVYFIIKNVTVHNSTRYYGIRLNNVSNSQLIDNRVYNNGYGIYLKGNNNIISRNWINQNHLVGIWFDGNNTVISENIVYSNNNGIILNNSNNNFISENTITGDSGGIALNINSNNNNISENIITHTSIGLYISDSNNSTILGNSFDDNAIGISLSGNNSNISENIIENSNWHGIGISTHSNKNLIYLNCFNNSNNVHDDSSNNSWDNGIKGNYWEDYTGADTDNNGIGDVPYDITDQDDVKMNQDNYPLMECTISIPSQEENIIPGYDPFFLIGMIGMIAVIFLHRSKKSFKIH